MTVQNDLEALILAVGYNLSPPRAVYPARIRLTNTGKYEPDHFPTAELRCMVLAHYNDKTNIIVQYDPLFIDQFPYIVTGTLVPAAAGSYSCESGYNDRPTYVGPLRAFFIWWDGIDSWIINEQVGLIESLYWKRTDPAIIGDYAPYDGAAGTATVAAL